MNQFQHQRMNMMKVSYAVDCHVAAHQCPADGAGLAMVERLQGVRKLGYVPRARVRRKIECVRIGLRWPMNARPPAMVRSRMRSRPPSISGASVIKRANDISWVFEFPVNTSIERTSPS